MKKSLLLTLFILFYLTKIYSQIGYGGTPPSFEFPQVTRSAGQVYQVSVSGIDAQKLARQDEIAGRNGSPLRVAVAIPVEVDIDTTGEWITLPGSQRIWKQTLSAPGAKGIILSYEEFSIPEGGKLFIYNADQSQVIGAFTEKTNPGGGEFSTQQVNGEEITLEYVESAVSGKKPQIKVNSVGYVYFRSEEERAMFRAPSPGQSDNCMVNINCPEGDNWQDQKRGVVHLYFYNNAEKGWFVCSGSLINNTANDATPYVLSAHHCFFNPYYQAVQEANIRTAQFYFNYEIENCAGSTSQGSVFTESIVGCQIITHEVYTSGSDGMLLLLNEEVPEEWEPYFNGWDISGEAPESGVTIHHPDGDVKKISTYTTAPNSARYLPSAMFEHWWEVTYATTRTAHSVTSGGSSGAPLFNQDGLIVGTLSGGASYCQSNPLGGPFSPDLFGKISEHFKGIQEGGMKPYLDPLETGVTILEGYDPNPDRGKSIKQERQEENPGLILFPNPAETEININAGSIIRNIYVFDMKGQQLHETKDYHSSTFTLNISAWEKGIYTIVVEAENGKYSRKVFKQ